MSTDTKKFHACMVAGTHSGAGKTTVMMALAAALHAKGLTVQPFKGGPDYIDTSFHHEASGTRRCRNLDLFLLSPDTVRQTFERHSQGVDVALVEGMMGLYDGKNAEGKGSSAEIAKLLNLPVILVIDGSGMAGSAAAIALGFQKMDSAVRLSGIFFNRVNTERHYLYLKEAVESRTGIPCLGYLPKNAEIKIPERHLGLTAAGEMTGVAEKARKMAALLETGMKWEKFFEISSQVPVPEVPGSTKVSGIKNSESGTSGTGTYNSTYNRPFKIAVARDEAFSFYYEDNFDLLREAGARLVFYSPLHDQELPQADLLYFGGGFPELYAARLSSNTSMLSQIRNFYHEDGWIYAECGGLMYLSQAFCEADGKEFPLAGLIPGKTRMTEKLQNFGYHEITAAPDNFLFSRGAKVRSHEFHHSVWDGEGKQAPAYFLGGRREGFAGPRLIASYQHLHFGSVPGLTAALIHHIVKERNFVC